MITMRRLLCLLVLASASANAEDPGFAPGEEITMDYVNSYHPDTKRCRCGVPGCRGTINLIQR